MTRHPLKQAWLPAVLMTSAFVVCSAVLPLLPLRGGERPEPVPIPVFEIPGDDAIFVSEGREELSHLVLYYGIGPSIEHARQADILLFGNSRQQLGLREEVIAHEAERLGLKVFTIATGHADKTRFALELIRKHDLRPKVVIASGGPFVFVEGMSDWARAVMDMGPWVARKRMWERTAAWSVRSRLHRWLPHLDFFSNEGRYGYIHYRSERTGWWRNVAEPKGRIPVSTQPERPGYRFTLPLARELKRELDTRGALLVLTMVPYLETRSGHLPFLSSELGVSYVLPSFDDLYLADGSHLDGDSAMRYSKAFWPAFIGLEEVRKRFSLD